METLQIYQEDKKVLTDALKMYCRSKDMLVAGVLTQNNVRHFLNVNRAETLLSCLNVMSNMRSIK